MVWLLLLECQILADKFLEGSQYTHVWVLILALILFEICKFSVDSNHKPKRMGKISKIGTPSPTSKIMILKDINKYSKKPENHNKKPAKLAKGLIKVGN